MCQHKHDKGIATVSALVKLVNSPVTRDFDAVVKVRWTESSGTGRPNPHRSIKA